MLLRDEQTKSMTIAGLNLIGQALTIYDRDLRLVLCNAPFQNMFDLPDRFVSPGATFRDTITHLAQSGEYGRVDNVDVFVKERIDQARAFIPHYMERTRANGRTISVEGSPLPEGGWVTVYTDISATKAQEALLRARSDALSDQVLSHAEQLAQSNRELAAMITALDETKRQLTASEARARLTTEMLPAHVAHVGHAATVAAVFRRTISNHSFCGDQQACNRCCVLQRCAHNFGWIDHAELEHVAIFFGLRVETKRLVGRFADFASDDGTVNARVLSDLTQWCFKCFTHNRNTNVLVRVCTLHAVKCLASLNQSNTTTNSSSNTK